MDTSKKKENPNPRQGANILSILFFAYTAPMFKKGYHKDLDVEDVYDPLNGDRSTLLGDKLERKWEENLKKCKKTNKTPSFLSTIVSTFGWDFTKTGIILAIFELVLRLGQPLLLGQLLKFFNKDSQMSQSEALGWAGGVISVNLISSFFINQYLIMSFRTGMKVRVACCSLIYRKALRLSRTALGDTASGKVVNLLSNDVSRMDVCAPFIHYMWTAPVSAIMILYFMWTQAGFAGIIGMGVVFIVVPLQAYTGKLSSKFRLQTAYKTDERVRLMEEIISGIQVIKMYAWEKPFTKLIEVARRLELNVITKSSYVRGLYMTFNLFTTRAALYAAMASMIAFDQPIYAAKIFVFSSYFAILAHTMSSMFVRGISEIAEVLVALKRLQVFLLYDEFEVKEKIELNGNGLDKPKPTPQPDYALKLENLDAKWNPDTSDTVLHNLSVNIPKGKLVGIIGPVGCGKSSLLQTLLGELHIANGSIDVNGKISYACQEPWVFAASVRQNILFGEPYDRMKYNKVVKACSLKKDFEQFPHGDMTIVGDRGASLSGGQKARINLARAVYRQSDIYLLDDPLSAVDTHVGKHLFESCISSYLHGKTRILVTHQLQFLKDADYLILLKDGKIEQQGTFKDIINSDNEYAKLLTRRDEEVEKDEERKKRESTLKKKVSITSIRSDTTDGENEDADLRAEQAEQSSKGTVGGNLFFKYFGIGANVCVVIFVALLFLLAQISASGADFWVSFWSNQEELRSCNNTNLSNECHEPLLSQKLCMYIHTGFIVAIFVFAFVRSIVFYHLCMRCSQKLHNSMFSSIVRTTMRFYDTNPSGRILNRFSKDIGSIDELLPKSILDAAQVLLVAAGAVVLAAYVDPYCLIAVVLLAIAFSFVKKIYLKTSKNVKRIEGITRSPVFTHLNATLQGLTTIRAFGTQDILKQEFDKHQDLNTGAWFMFISSNTTFGFALDIMCFIFVFFVTFSFVIAKDPNSTGGNVGLAITQAMGLTGLVQWGMRQSADVQNQLMSVERVLEYSNLESEPNLESDNKPPPNWPKRGQIQFKDTYMRYAETEPHVLKNLNITIKPSEKVGIVGRTGAGKSSLIAALFRLAKVEGNILIDEVDTKDIGLQDLRSKISIIPQDPVLFSGTMRKNLDPFEEYPDFMLWKALDDVELKDVIASSNQLESKVMDHGSNYSVGQRQLVCLARAILRNNKILMLDEATANVDPQTDKLIQTTIREKFATCTVLTVAHRLNTIMDSDKVLVMDAGSMVEFDHPHILCQNKNGHFYKMVEETGPVMTEQLCQIAKDAYIKSQMSIIAHLSH